MKKLSFFHTPFFHYIYCIPSTATKKHHIRNLFLFRIWRLIFPAILIVTSLLLPRKSL